MVISVTLFLKTQKKFICIFWVSENGEPSNPKKVHINSWFDDIPIKKKNSVLFQAVFRIRIHMFLGLMDPNPEPLVRGIDPDPDPSIINQK